MRKRWLAAASVVALMAAALVAQQPQAPIFRGGVNLVHLDVSVLDRDRRPVRGLTAADFTVLDDGKPQPIVAFSAIDVPETAAPSATWRRNVAPDVQANTDANLPESRLFVLLLDDALMPFDAASIQNAKRIARRVIEQASPADRIAVVFSAGSAGTQNFTNDRARLLAAVETLNPTFAKHTLGWESAPPSQIQQLVSMPVWPLSDPDIPYRQASMRTLNMVAETLMAAPERRKVLLFVSPGLSVDPASVSIPLARGYKSPPLAIKMANDDIVNAMPELYRRMRLANVTIYPIDPGGLDGFESYTLQVARGLPALRTPQVGPLPADFNWFAPLVAPPPEALAQRVATLSMDFLMTAASNTGGRAIVNTNDFEAGIDQVFRENGSFYLIGVAVRPGAAAGSLHRLNVQVKRPDVEVRTRSGYEMPRAAPEAGDKAVPPVVTTVAGPIAKGDLPMRVALAPFATPKGPIVAIALGLRQDGVEKSSVQTFDLHIGAFTPDGQPRSRERRSASVTLVPVPGSTTADFEFLSQIALAPGRYELRVGAQRTSDGAAGSVYADVDVPDFARAPLSLSGIVVDSSPAVAGGPRDLFATLIPIVPTASREFRPAGSPASCGSTRPSTPRRRRSRSPRSSSIRPTHGWSIRRRPSARTASIRQRAPPTTGSGCRSRA
jgi:VWFA-related protein